MIGILSDVHGNDPALEAVLAEMDRLGASRVVSLGDVAGYYCGLDRCVDLLRARDALHVMGNHDWYLVAGAECPRSSSANRCLERQRTTVSTASMEWLRASVPRLDFDAASMVHGGWTDPLDEYLYTVSAKYFANLPGRYFFSGHTHVQGLWNFPGKTYCNPGSVGQPRDGDARAAFATWEDDSVVLHRVPYDVEATCARMAAAGFEERFFANLRVGTRIGGGLSRVVTAD